MPTLLSIIFKLVTNKNKWWVWNNGHEDGIYILSVGFRLVFIKKIIKILILLWVVLNLFSTPNGKTSRGILIFAYVHKKKTPPTTCSCFSHSHSKNAFTSSNNLFMFLTLTFKCFCKFQWCKNCLYGFLCKKKLYVTSTWPFQSHGHPWTIPKTFQK